MKSYNQRGTKSNIQTSFSTLEGWWSDPTGSCSSPISLLCFSYSKSACTNWDFSDIRHKGNRRSGKWLEKGNKTKVTLEIVQHRKACNNGKSWFHFQWHLEVLSQGQLMPWDGDIEAENIFPNSHRNWCTLSLVDTDYELYLFTKHKLMKHKCYLLIKDSKRPWDCSASPAVENVFSKIMNIKGIFVFKWIIGSFYLSETESCMSITTSYEHNSEDCKTKSK